VYCVVDHYFSQFPFLMAIALSVVRVTPSCTPLLSNSLNSDDKVLVNPISVLVDKPHVHTFDTLTIFIVWSSLISLVR